ncbi:MAG: epoxide hydrolase [bacterium]
MSLQPYRVAIPDATLDDLQVRLAAARMPESDDASWGAGTSPAFVRQLADYWQTGFDWRSEEARINRFAHFHATIDGLRIHFIHERGNGETPLPIILTHGYPDSFLRFTKLIPLLTDPASHGGDASDAFDVVVPSLPGFGFSDKPATENLTFHVGDLWQTLMTKELGYERFGAHGGDWGSTVTEHLARSHADSVVGIHLTDVPFWHAFQKPSHPSPAEEKFLAGNAEFMQKEGAYAMIQGTRPRTLAQGLNDSPLGLAAWIIEKFQRWSDCDGDVERRFSKTELLSNVMIYWATETIGSSFVPYADFTNAGAMRWIVEAAKQWKGACKVPTGFARFPKDIGSPPREWAERFYEIQRWVEMPRGGHFAAMEEPQLLAEELRTFFRPLRPVNRRRIVGESSANQLDVRGGRSMLARTIRMPLPAERSAPQRRCSADCRWRHPKAGTESSRVHSRTLKRSTGRSSEPGRQIFVHPP